MCLPLSKALSLDGEVMTDLQLAFPAAEPAFDQYQLLVVGERSTRVCGLQWLCRSETDTTS